MVIKYLVINMKDIVNCGKFWDIIWCVVFMLLVILFMILLCLFELKYLSGKFIMWLNKFVFKCIKLFWLICIISFKCVKVNDILIR